jgi:hypothetical protein
MRWARQQEGVTVTRRRVLGRLVRWDRGASYVSIRPLPDDVHVRAGHSTAAIGLGTTDAAQVLRVLAALDLIPADIAYAADERYGKCLRCDRLAQWVPPTDDLFPSRWVHVKRLRFDGQPHMPDVAA